MTNIAYLLQWFKIKKSQTSFLVCIFVEEFHEIIIKNVQMIPSDTLILLKMGLKIGLCIVVDGGHFKQL